MYEQLQIHDRMQKEFINTAAHELRTPIQPLLGLAQILRSKAKDKEQIELLDIVIRNTKKLRVLAENILDISKIESNSLKLNKQNFSLDGLILDIVKELGNKLVDENKEIKFEYSNLTNTYALIYGDKNRIGQVISNLIGNSIKFINQKEGIISISVRKGKKRGNDKDTVVVVEIKDSGIGIDPEIFPKLFTKFATKSFQGTGLGLYICKNIIEAHGGQIWAENNTNDNNKDGKKGATFSFSMPLKD